MMPSRVIEPITGFENSTTTFRRKWAEQGADWTFQILQFLAGMRQNEIGLAEILKTQIYAASTPREKDSFKWVAAQAEQLSPISDEDRRRLAERDDWLMQFVAGTTLGQRDWVTEIEAIPAHVARAQRVDAGLFSETFKSPILFSWVWARARG